MSKYSKALEKIQEERDANAVELKEKAASFEIPETAGDFKASWDRGIPMVRNAKPDHRIVAYHYPTSMLSHNLKIHLAKEVAKEGAKVILVSSSVHGEGKTVTAVNLALSLIEMGNSKVALLDADLRRGKIAEYLGLGKELAGLSGYLSNGTSAKQAMVRNSIENLTIIPAGQVLNNPSGLIGSQKIRLLIAELRGHFDYVVVDSPPIMAVADAGILGREADGLLMVIRCGHTPKTVVAHSNILFRQSGVRLLGYILTNVEFQSADYRYYYHYHNNVYQQNLNQDGNLSLKDRWKNYKKRTLYQLKQFGSQLEQKERDFNQWWEDKVLKHKTKPKAKIDQLEDGKDG